MTGMNEDRELIEERAIDALLAETLGKAAAPDLSQQIFEQLRVTPSDVGSIVCTDDRASRRETSIQKQVTVVIAVIATLAASIFVAVWLRSDHRFENPSFAGLP